MAKSVPKYVIRQSEFLRHVSEAFYTYCFANDAVHDTVILGIFAVVDNLRLKETAKKLNTQKFNCQNSKF